MTTTAQDIVRPIALTFHLFFACWPQLLLVGCIGYIVRELLLEAAVSVAMANPLGGMVTLSLVVLTKLVVFILMFVALRPYLPALAAMRRGVAESDAAAPVREPVLAITAAAILPFFAYYAAWGFLGDTVREYSRMALARFAMGESPDIFAVGTSKGAIYSIVACWIIRFVAKRLDARAPHVVWRVIIVAANASWIFIGLYALDTWKDEFIKWLGAGGLLEQVSALSFVSVAYAAEGFVPVEFRPTPFGTQLQSLFFYALLPMVWLVMAAIINGYDLAAKRQSAASPVSRRRKWLNDFVSHYLGGYRSRYTPVWTCLKLTISAGIATLVTFVIAYRLIGWAGGWSWYGLTRLIGAHELGTWQVIADVITIFIGSPSELDGGILLDALRICLLAAVLEYAVATAGRDRVSSAVL